MTNLGTCLLAVWMSGVLTLPVGLCCGGNRHSGCQAESAEHCCRTQDEQATKGAIPAKPDCCLKQASATATSTQSELQPVGPSVSAFITAVESELKQVLVLHLDSVHVGNGNSLQSLYCVWRR